VVLLYAKLCDFEWFVFDLADVAIDLAMNWLTVQAGVVTGAVRNSKAQQLLSVITNDREYGLLYSRPAWMA